MKIICDKDELLRNDEFQAALAIVLPRLEGYITSHLLMETAGDATRQPAEKGIYLECVNDLMESMRKITRTDQPPKPAPPERPALRNTQFRKTP